ncbi:MAG: class I SAM-dependent methyltransferase, partial [Clostridiales Family XIII bacterium]|nr:class I SAM-dependent methyltransferase [Clostridiales Family XIII bacterium]
MVLSDRLAAIASFIEEGQSVADIGTDHAYLPLFLLEHAISPAVVITDVAEGPLAVATENLRMAGFPWFEGRDSRGAIPDSVRVSVRQGDGLACIAQGETDVCVIAGMGGELIVRILDAELEKARAFKLLIFQPRTKLYELRHYLEAQGFVITRERLA